MASFDEIHQVLNKLINENKALTTQAMLLDSFVAIARAPVNKAFHNSALQKILTASIIISQAENGSLFLFDSKGGIRKKILSRYDFADQTSTPDDCKVLNDGLAGWVMRHREVVRIEDTLKDERWLTHPDQLNLVRSVLAIPIQRGNRLMGLITLQHSKPYKFAQETVNLMQATADQIALVLENIGLYAKLDTSYRELNKAKNKVDAYSLLLSRELRKGREIQKEFFPEHLPEIKGWEFRTYFKPAMQLSGDFYDIFRIDGSHVGIVIADVCDKGVGAALYMALFRSLVRIFSGSFTPYSVQKTISRNSPQEALQCIQLTNDYIVTLHDRMATFATIFLGVIDTGNGDFSYINAGHDPPTIMRATGERDLLMPTGPVVGAFPNVNFGIQHTQILRGDLFWGYTDGVTDAVSPGGEIFGKNRLQMIVDQQVKSAKEFEKTITDRLFSHINDAAQADDITFMLVSRR